MQPGFYTDQSSLHSGDIPVPVQFTIGAAGAVNSPLGISRGILSVVHGATGVYTITLNSPAVRMYLGSFEAIQASYSSSGACKVQVTADNSAATTPTIVLLCTTAAGAAVDPASGDKIYGIMHLQWMSAQKHA